MNKIIKVLKHTFIPHKHNDFKPHFFRELSIITISVVAIVMLSISASTTLFIKFTDMTATVLPAVLVDLTNNARTGNNEQALTRNSTLDQAARLKAEDMARLGYFAHTSPEGVTPWHWFNEAGYYFAYAGENLAINFTESVDVEGAWLNSPTHKANIMNSKFTEIGIATADGMYQGRPTTFVVQEFGTPAIPSKAEVKSVSQQTKETTEVTTPIKKPKESEPKVPTSTVVAIAPTVKGESVESVKEVKSTKEATVKENNLKTIANTKDFIAVENNEIAKSGTQIPDDKSTHYSSWYERFIFKIPKYTDSIYHIMMWIVIIALIIMTIMEVRIQHPRNIMYGLLLLVIILCLVYINRTMFSTGFIS